MQSVNNRTQSLREILRMVIIDIVINTLLARLTLLPVCIVRHGTMLLFSSYRFVLKYTGIQVALYLYSVYC